jgi:MtrB/PioB family decaheme-associated outer membrane protein
MTRSRNTAIALTALAAAISGALAQEATQVTGSVSLTGIYSDVKSDNAFRFEEYRDLDKGVTGGMDIRAYNGPWWFDLFGENIARDDQYIRLKGGRYGIFKFAVYGDDIIHNTTFGASLPFTGIGTRNLTFAGAAPSTNVSTWNRFDYGVKHENLGGFAEGQATPDSPLYFRVQTNRKKSDGIRPLGAPGTSPGGPAYELAAPINWTTTDVSGEMGYTSRKMHLAVSYTYSKFEDDNEFLFWRTPLVTTGPNTEKSTIAMDNKLERLGLNGVFRGLPLDSSLAVRGVHTKTTSDFAIFPTFLSVSGTTGNDRLANASSPNFNGEVVNDSASVSLSSHLARGWDSKVYYNWYRRENNSSHIVFTPGGPGSGGTCDVNPTTAASLTTCTTEFLHYEKNNAGVEFYYRLSPGNRIAFGYDYLDTERERFDFDQTTEQKGWIELKTRALKWADVRLKYFHMNRTSNFLLGSYPNGFEQRIYRFDAAPLDRDVLKLTFDTSPAPLLDLGAEVIYKVNRYADTPLGRTKDTREELNLSASYGDMKVFRVSAFADFEHTQYDSNHWVGSITTYPNAALPSAYPWLSNVKDRNWLFGVAADWTYGERLRFYGSFIYTKANGEVDFQAPSVANAIPIDQYDNYKKQQLNVKATYAATKQLDVVVGAAYEKYTYSDIQMDGYIQNIRTGSNQNFFSGAYANPNYRASILYVTLTYHF